MDEPKITQAIIDAYDEYTHLTLDRREFMRTLKTLAGSATAAAALLPLLTAGHANAETIATTDPRLDGSDIVFPGASGPVNAYLVIANDAPAKTGAVIIIHENRGLNAHIRDVARRMALEGFVVLAPDFLSQLGGTPPDEDKARELTSTLDAEKTVGDGKAGLAFLSSHARSNGKVGAVGFCWGGGLVSRLAVAEPDLVAGVSYYGSQPKSADVAAIKAALLLHYAGLDERINKGIEDFRTALSANGKDFTMHVYEGVNHAFNNDTSPARYNKQAADLAWGRTVEFLKARLLR